MSNNSAVFKEGYHKLLQLLEHRWQQQSEPGDLNQFVKQGMAAYRYSSDISEQQLNEIENQLRVDLTAFIESMAPSTEDYRDSPQFLAIQGTLWQWLWQISDNSQVEWQELAEDFQHDGVYHSGEVVGLGRLECNKCKHHLYYYHPDILPTCPECNSNQFKRIPLRP